MHCNYSACDRLLTYRPPRIAVALLGTALVIHFLLAGDWLAFTGLPLTGALLSAAGFLLMMRAWWLFKQTNNAICPTAMTTAFITRDVFSWTRNPMYLGMVLILSGIGFAMGSGLVLLATLVYALALDHTFCRYEEKKLDRLFGDEYRAYAKSVRRWI